MYPKQKHLPTPTEPVGHSCSVDTHKLHGASESLHQRSDFLGAADHATSGATNVVGDVAPVILPLKIIKGSCDRAINLCWKKDPLMFMSNEELWGNIQDSAKANINAKGVGSVRELLTGVISSLNAIADDESHARYKITEGKEFCEKLNSFFEEGKEGKEIAEAEMKQFINNLHPDILISLLESIDPMRKVGIEGKFFDDKNEEYSKFGSGKIISELGKKGWGK